MLNTRKVLNGSRPKNDASKKHGLTLWESKRYKDGICCKWPCQACIYAQTKNNPSRNHFKQVRITKIKQNECILVQQQYHWLNSKIKIYIIPLKILARQQLWLIFCVWFQFPPISPSIVQPIISCDSYYCSQLKWKKEKKRRKRGRNWT